MTTQTFEIDHGTNDDGITTWWAEGHVDKQAFLTELQDYEEWGEPAGYTAPLIRGVVHGSWVYDDGEGCYIEAEFVDEWADNDEEVLARIDTENPMLVTFVCSESLKRIW